MDFKNSSKTISSCDGSNTFEFESIVLSQIFHYVFIKLKTTVVVDSLVIKKSIKITINNAFLFSFHNFPTDRLFKEYI